MRIVILGYTGLIGHSILENLANNSSFDLVCVGRNIKNKLYRRERIKYFKWDFITFKEKNLSFLKKANIIINCVGKTNNDKSNLENVNFIFIKKLLKHIKTYQSKVRLIHLGSVAVYGGAENYLNQSKIITENTTTNTNNLYSKSKLKGDMLIKNTIKRNLNKNLSFTILRISNVFGKKKNSNLYKFVMFTLKLGVWIKTSNEIMYNFVHVKDVSQVVNLIISKLKVSRNKTYIVSDDFRQYELYDVYQNLYKKKIINILFPISVIKFLIYFLPMPKIILNFFLIISSKVTYSNKKIRKELNFNPKSSLLKKIKLLNE
jgi:nucleoside-diphosphate-sugar epimerase